MNRSGKGEKFDGIRRAERRARIFDFPLAQFVSKYKKSSVWFSGKGRVETFFTADSKLYLTPEELRRLRRGERINQLVKRLDGIASRIFEPALIYPVAREDIVLQTVREKYSLVRGYLEHLLRDSTQGLSLVRMWNASIVISVIFGMVLMTMVYRYLGQSVAAEIKGNQIAQQNEIVLGAETENDPNYEIDDETITKLFREYDSAEDQEFQRQQFEKEIREMVKGYPIEKMIPEIAKQDRIVAAFIVAIAKKESGWGKRVPVYQGQDCFNYWGWIGKNRVGSGGHTCFVSPEEAVETVAKRIKFLVSNEKLNTPKKMIVWKCGDCGWDNAAAMQSWINDVDMYFRKLNKD